MKGPHCQEEINEALNRFDGEYELVFQEQYRIPKTPHERRLVVFRRTGESRCERKVRAMNRFFTRKIESDQNNLFKDLKKLLTGRGVKKQGKALMSGTKQVSETLRDFPHLCQAWISSGDGRPPPENGPSHLEWRQLSPSLFHKLDIYGTHAPMLLIGIENMEEWETEAGFPWGCTVMIPFQDPENVGACIRSAVAFGASRIVLLAESAHPYHPKALRASGGATLHASLLQGPSIEELPEELPIIPLSSQGTDLEDFTFPDTFALLPGMEGPGLPESWKENAISIAMSPRVESLNASVATAIALFKWSQRNKDRRFPQS
jgi:16S rRNA (guanine527-N7)-methyltransferase